MARMTCICGNHLSNSTHPEIQYWVNSFDEWNEAMEKSEAGVKLLDIGLPRISIWKCSKCERLYVFESHRDEPLRVYKIEIKNEGDW